MPQTRPRLATLLALTYGHFDADRRAELEEHVSNCEQCKAIYRTYAEMWDALEMEMFEDEPQDDPPLEMHATLMLRIKNARSREDRVSGTDADPSGLVD